jgi:polyisoprenoid-binding protein YceI
MQAKKLFLAAALVGGAALLASLRSPAAQPGALFAAQPAALPAGASGPATYAVDAGHSAVIFRVMHMNTAWVFGRFNEFSGTLVFDAERPADCSVEIQVQATSVDTASRGRDDHLRGSDFFEAKQFPTISFKSTAVKGLGAGRFELTGDLTLRGHTEQITFELEKTGEGKNRQGKPMVGFLGEFTVDRMAHGVSYMPGGLGEQVTVIVSLEAVETAPAR